MTESKLAEEIKHLESESKNINKRAREHYLEQISDFSEKIKQLGDNASVKAKQVIDKVGDYVSENPQKSALVGIGIGLGVGLLLGYLLKKNNKED